MVATDPKPAPAPPARRGRTATALDVLVLVAVALLLLFPLVAWLAARAQPIEPGPVVRLPALSATGKPARLTGTPRRADEQRAVAAVGGRRAARPPSVSAGTLSRGCRTSTYPYDDPSPRAR